MADTEPSKPSAAAAEYLRESLAPATLQCYETAWIRKERYSAENKVNTLPASPIDVGNFISEVAKESYCSFSSIKRLTAAINYRHELANLVSPTSSSFCKRVMTGIEKALFRHPRQKKPMTTQIARTLIEKYLAADLHSGKTTNIVHWRTITRVILEFITGSRFGEVIALRPCDFTFTDQDMTLFIRKSKTDQKMVGANKTVVRDSESPFLCPVHITEQYLARLGYPASSEFSIMPQFRSTQGRNSRVTSVIPGSSVSHSTAIGDLKSLLASIGINPAEYGEHSGRSGCATESYAAGADIPEIQQKVGWASGATAAHYVQSSPETKRRKSDLFRISDGARK